MDEHESDTELNTIEITRRTVIENPSGGRGWTAPGSGSERWYE